jgi:hypothetical protein
MTAGEISTDERQARLDAMRAEFRAAQQRRYEAIRPSLVKEVRPIEPEPVPEAETPAVATPSE